MKSEAARRWLIRAVVLAVIAVFGAWIASNTTWDDLVVTGPLKGEAATNPQYAERIFLEALNVRVESRQSLSSLPPTSAAIVVNFWHWDLIDSRRQKLEAWVRAGGRLIVDATLIGSVDGFAQFSGVKRQFPERKQSDDSADAEADEDTAGDAEDNDGGAIVDRSRPAKCVLWNVSLDVNGASADRDHYSLCNIGTFGWLVTDDKPTWAVRDKAGIQAVRVPIGKGDVTVINAFPFNNRSFHDVERGALFVAATQLRRDDEMWLLTEADHPSLLTLIWRFGAPVVLFFGLFVVAVLWRNAVRFGPLVAPSSVARRSLAEQIRGTGWFILRLGGTRTLSSAMRRALQEAAERRIFGYGRLTPARQLGALIAHTGIDSEALQAALSVTAKESGDITRHHSRQDLYRAIAILETARRALIHEKTRAQSNSPSAAHEATHAN